MPAEINENENEAIPQITLPSITDIDVDQALERTGAFGKYQIIIQFIAMIFVITTSFHAVVSYFIANDPSWRCASNATSDFCSENFNKTFSIENRFFNKRCELDRDQWSYTTPKIYSYITEFDLICKYSSLGATISAAYFIGGLFGSIVSGRLADTYGRKPVLIGSFLFTAISAIACAFITNIWQLLALRVWLGASHVSCYTISYVYLMEIVAPDYRVLSGIIYQLTFCLSCALIDLVAYFEREWRELQLYASLACLPVLIVYFFLHESPRWYFANNKNSLAEKILKKINRYNQKAETELHLKTSSNALDNTSYSSLDLATWKKLGILTSSLAFLWTGLSISYYAVSFASSNLGGDMYTSLLFTTLVDIPSTFATLYSSNRFGRKKTVLGGSFLAGILLISVATVPRSFVFRYEVVITLVTLAKFFTEFAFSGVYIWTFELYPTTMRSQGLSICVSFEKIGAIAAPYLSSVLMAINVNLPFVIMSSITLVGAFLGLILPETRGMPTRETFDDLFNENEKKLGNDNGKSVGVANEGLDSAV